MDPVGEAGLIGNTTVGEHEPYIGPEGDEAIGDPPLAFETRLKALTRAATICWEVSGACTIMDPSLIGEDTCGEEPGVPL